jgi:hypothetical protein
MLLDKQHKVVDPALYSEIATTKGFTRPVLASKNASLTVVFLELIGIKEHFDLLKLL